MEEKVKKLNSEQNTSDQLEDSSLEQQEEDSWEWDESYIEQQMEQQAEDAAIEAAMEQQAEDAAIEAAIEAAMEQQAEDAAIEAAIEASWEQQAEEAAIEQQIEDSMFNNHYGYAKSPDKCIDYWIAFYDDLKTESSEKLSTLSKENLLNFIHKKYVKSSQNGGRTAYFSYHIKDKNQQDSCLEIGAYACEEAETEHWVSWKYKNMNIDHVHYLTKDHRQNDQYGRSDTFTYPIDYAFASIIPLNKYNPFGFCFEKLNFLKEKDDSFSCGDRFSRLCISDIHNRGYIFELSIYKFELNILPLLKGLNEVSGSFIDFKLKIYLEHSIKYLKKIKTDLAFSMSYLKSKIENEKSFQEYLKTGNIDNLKMTAYMESPVSISVLKEVFHNIRNKMQEMLKLHFSENVNEELDTLVANYSTLIAELDPLLPEDVLVDDDLPF